MHRSALKILVSSCLVLVCGTLTARTGFYRATFREDPATTVSIGWTQFSGSGPLLYYGTEDRGTDYRSYTESREPDSDNNYHGLENRFVRLRNLRPNTKYYFVICDSEGCSERMYFQTAPNDPNTRLSVVAGGDSRNNREARRDANLMAGKLRPNFILFGGDMTRDDTPAEWRNWFEDWQLVIGDDGYLPPIVPARGNHEQRNATITELFDVRNSEVYYALNFGGDLLRVYTLNTMIAANGDQLEWLRRDLNAHPGTTYKIAQYHQTMRPHTQRKPEKNELIVYWAPLFYKHGMSLVVESDAHVVKATYPIRPSSEPGSSEGFVRDDFTGTVYVGEGCWGAPLRSADDLKPWTRAAGSFNQFKWLWIDKNKIEVRTVKTDGSESVGALSVNDRFRMPSGIRVWDPPSGKVIEIPAGGINPNRIDPNNVGEVFAMRGEDVVISGFSAGTKQNNVVVTWSTDREPPGMFYEVQRKTGDQWQTLGRVGGKASKNNQYDYTDIDAVVRFPGQFLEYRLKRITPEGGVSYQGIDNRPSANIQAPNTKPVVNRRNQPRNNPRDWEHYPKVLVGTDKEAKIKFILPSGGSVRVQVLDRQFQQIRDQSLAQLGPGTHLKSVLMGSLDRGLYYLIVESNGEAVQRYRAVIR